MSAAVLSSAVPFGQRKTRVANARCGMGFSYGNAVKNTVRHMVSNLECVITNLQGIVGDLHILVKQIDVVTNKMDAVNTYNGTQWTKPSTAIYKKKTTKIVKKSQPVKQPETKTDNSVSNWQEMAETRAEQGPSPDIDWSYLSLTNNNCDDAQVRQTNTSKVTLHPCAMRRIREPNPYLSSCGASSECDVDADECQVTKDSKVRACCDFVLDSLKYENHSIETSNEDLVNPTPVVPEHVFCEEVVGSNAENAYCGMYESAMESKLEILSEYDDNDDDDDDDLSLDRHSDIDDDRPSIRSCDFKADYNRCVNPWTSFNMVHVDSSTHDSDDLVSDCASDILNENYIDSSSVNSGYENIVLTLPHHVCF